MGVLLFSHIPVTNVKLMNEKSSLNITVSMLVNPQKSIILLRFLRTSYNSMSGVAQACSKVVVAWMWSPTYGNLSYLQGLHPYWFQRHLNSKILKRDFQLPTIMGVQSNISLCSCLVVVVCITPFRLVLVHSEFLRILVQWKNLNMCFSQV